MELLKGIYIYRAFLNLLKKNNFLIIFCGQLERVLKCTEKPKWSANSSVQNPTDSQLTIFIATIIVMTTNRK